jgi:hypothetical protein
LKLRGQIPCLQSWGLVVVCAKMKEKRRVKGRGKEEEERERRGKKKVNNVGNYSLEYTHVHSSDAGEMTCDPVKDAQKNCGVGLASILAFGLDF